EGKGDPSARIHSQPASGRHRRTLPIGQPSRTDRRAATAYPRRLYVGPVRVCIVGAGAVGGLLGARLGRAGRDATARARGESLTAIRANGLTVVEPDGAMSVAPDVVAADDLAVFGPQDLVVLAVKAHQIVDIADRLDLLYDDGTVVVPLQNGVPWWFFQ